MASSVPDILVDGISYYLYGPNVGAAPIEQIAIDGATPTYLVSDTTGVREQLDSAGDVTGSMSFTSYGMPCGLCTISTAFGFEGGYTDATGLIYLVHRYYDPSTGQFLSVDPDVAQTGEPYTYVGGDPANGTDPTGLKGGPGVGALRACGYEGSRSTSESCEALRTREDRVMAARGSGTWWADVSSFVEHNYGTIAQIAAGAACVVVTAGVCILLVVTATATHLIQLGTTNSLTASNAVGVLLLGFSEVLTAGISGILEHLGQEASPLLYNLVTKGVAILGSLPFQIINFSELSSGTGAALNTEASVNGSGRCLRET
jgi:RHS repeat-associated protein